ncbi:MAG: type II secretion system F family protein [Acidobacteria bacterium]|nr:type II secretion system F family protein [Acidobacteriota bacterium]
MEFRCRLGTPAGEIVEGLFAADSESRLRHEFEQKGLCVLSLQPRSALGGLSLELPRRRRVPGREFLVFNQELATLLKAGMPLVQSLDILRQRATDSLFRTVLDDVHERVRAGTALSDAFAAHQELFPGVYTASLLAGEKSGSLDSTIRRYVAYTKVITGVKRRMISALIYPAVLVGLALIVVSIILFKVVPEFALFYESFNAELPPLTRVMVGVATLLRQQFLLILVVVAGLVAGLLVWLQQADQRTRFDRLVLRIPLAGALARKFATSQLARTMGTLLGGGIPLVNAIDVAARSIGNHHIARELQVVGVRVREGSSFATALEERGVFPAVAVKMTEVGESTGALQDMLNSLADFYDEEIETDLGRFVTLIEPILLAIMGIVIAVLLLSLYLPLLNLSAVVGGS